MVCSRHRTKQNAVSAFSGAVSAFSGAVLAFTSALDLYNTTVGYASTGVAALTLAGGFAHLITSACEHLSCDTSAHYLQKLYL
jgi:hypothetical protein